MPYLTRTCLLALLLSFATHAAALRDGLALAVGPAPTPVRSGSTQRLAYELHLANYADVPLTLERIDVLDPSSATLASLSGDELRETMRLAGAGRDEPATRSIPPGRNAIIYLDLRLDARRAAPPALRHRITWSRDDRVATTIEGADIPVSPRAPVVLGAPLGAGEWVALYDPSMTRGHRRVAFAIDGGLRIPARHAIDWMRVDAGGRLFHRDEQDLANWYGYGADVLAVADATVVALRDSITEPARLDASTRHPLEDASGNYVSLDLGDGRYVHYEHLQPGSVRVRVGERVRRGRVIAKLGFTGDASGPHLHMHVSDGPAPLAGEGLPFVFAHYASVGDFPSMSALGRPYARASSPREHANELPAAGAVVRFRDGD